MERLLDFFQPQNYQLQFQINKQLGLVTAKALISGRQLQPVFKFHAKNLTIRSAQLKIATSTTPLEFKTIADTLIFDHSVTSGQDLTIEIAYSFKLKHNMQGVYLSNYSYQDQKQLIVATQFESHYARQAFPCIDEPAAKATFDLKIITSDLEDQIIANTPIKSQKIVEYQTIDQNFSLNATAKKKITIFETTPKMSTYLLAFCLGRFHQASITSKNGVKITSYCALNHQPETLDYANQTAALVLDYYDQLFGVPYPLPKLDQVALPDFESGAMENWGLVTYRESCLLAGKSASLDSKEYIATVIAHELSHQWFGNLVTMSWWDDLWLNESFATMIEYLAVDHIYPKYQIWQNFFTGECLSALRRDALPGVQSVRQPVSHPEEISTLFDGAIVYAKGARLMLMLMRLIGQDRFFAGLKSYFLKHQYQNTTGDDLWAALQPYADFDIKQFMTSWLEQPGYPVLQISSEQSTSQQLKITSAQRFFITDDTDQTRWILPQIYDDMSGHYLIDLSPSDLSNKLAIFDNLSLEQKFRLIIDQILLSKSPNFHHPESLFELALGFRTEDHYALWSLISGILADFRVFFPPNSDLNPKYRHFVRRLIAPCLESLGLHPRQSDTNDQIKLRPLILSQALYTEDRALTADLAQLYRPDFNLDPEIRYAILQAYFRNTKESNFQTLLDSYINTADPDLKDDLFTVITSARQPEPCAKLITMLGDQNLIKPQDHLFFVARLLNNSKTKADTLNWIYQNWPQIETISGEKSLEDYPRLVSRYITTKSEASAFFDFFDQFNQHPILGRAIQIAHSDIDARLKWLETNRPKIQAYIKNHPLSNSFFPQKTKNL